MLHTKFRRIGPMVLEENIFEVISTYMGMAAILVMCQYHIHIFIFFLILESLHKKLGSKRLDEF